MENSAFLNIVSFDVCWFNSFINWIVVIYDWINSNLVVAYLVAQFIGSLLRKIFTNIITKLEMRINFSRFVFRVSKKFMSHMFGGLLTVGQTTDFSIQLIRDVLFTLYKIAKGSGLISEYFKPILSKLSYNKSDTDTEVFINKAKIQSQKVLGTSQSHVDLVLFSDEFAVICGKCISSSQARLYIHCVGGIFGAIYDVEDYSNMINIASTMTIDNDSLIDEPSAKFNKFLYVVKHFISSKQSQEFFVLSAQIEVNDLKITNPSYKSIDINKILFNNLRKAIQLSSQV